MADTKISALTPTTNPQGLEHVGARGWSNFRIDLWAAIDAIVNAKVQNWILAPTPQVSDNAGDLYVDTAGKDIYLYDWAAWIKINIDIAITVSGAAPWSAGINTWDMHLNTATAGIYIWDGITWKLNDPTWGGWPIITSWSWAPWPGWVTTWDIYVDTDNGDLYSWDGLAWNLNNAETWVVSNAPAIAGTDRNVAVFDGSSWQEIIDTPVNIDASGNITWVNDLGVGWTATINNLDVTGDVTGIEPVQYRHWTR